MSENQRNVFKSLLMSYLSMKQNKVWSRITNIVSIVKELIYKQKI